MNKNAKEHDIIHSKASDLIESDTPYLIKWVNIFDHDSFIPNILKSLEF